MNRLRRLRRNQQIRDLFSQAKISVDNLIMPYFVIEGKDKKEEIKSMPGIYRFSIDNLIKDTKQIRDLGIKAILLFGIPNEKDSRGSQSFDSLRSLRIDTERSRMCQIILL